MVAVCGEEQECPVVIDMGENEASIIRFHSVSHDEMERSSASFSMDDAVWPVSSLPLGDGAIIPEARTSSPILDSMSSNIFSFGQLPRWNNNALPIFNSTGRLHLKSRGSDPIDAMTFPLKRKLETPRCYELSETAANKRGTVLPASDELWELSALMASPFITAAEAPSFLMDFDFLPSMQSNPLNYSATDKEEPSSKILLSSQEFSCCSSISFDDLIVTDQIGEGIGSDVFRVIAPSHLPFAQRSSGFALKKLKRVIRSPKQEEIAAKELTLLHHLNELPCPNIPQLFIAWKEERTLYALLELAPYGSMEQLLHYHRQGEVSLTLPFLWHLLHEVATALQFLHGQGIVHLDVKAANLLVFEQGVIKLGDFGMATIAGKTIDTWEEAEGDNRYLPPELLNSDERFFSADVFSLGILLYEALTVISLPPSSQTKGKANESILPENGPLWLQLRSGDIPFLENTPRSLEEVIRAMMSPSPQSRPTATTLLSHSEVKEVEGRPESYLMIWEKLSQRSLSFSSSSSSAIGSPVKMNRSSSFDPSRMSFPLISSSGV